MVEERKSWYKEIKVCAMVVFDPKAINHQRKGNVAEDVTEETRKQGDREDGLGIACLPSLIRTLVYRCEKGGNRVCWRGQT